MNAVKFLALLLMLTVILLTGCGGGSKTGSSSSRDGRIEVLNIVNESGSTRVPMHVSYVNNAGETIETVVEVGEQKLVTGNDILEGGTTVKLVFRPQMNCYVVAEKEVSIDGNIIVRIPYIGPCGSGVVTIEVVSG